MRHRKKSEKFSRSRAQRKALVKSLLQAVVKNERIITTTSRAKYLRGAVDRLITWGKHGTLADKRLAYKALGDHTMVTKLFDGIAPRFPKTQGGYTRVLRAGTRKGDGASLSLLELTKVEKKRKAGKVPAAVDKLPEGKSEKAAPKKEKKSTNGIASRVKKIFKKDQQDR
jgi:large subunit ribosomal protein L17